MIERALHLLLAERLGLAAEAVGKRTIDHAVARRMAECGLARPEAYLARVMEDAEEWDALLERVVVPETWFFRNAPAFQFLSRFAASEWLPANKTGKLRVLSIPCSTGEEPYSIAMCLLHAGIPADRFQIDAVDVSGAAIARACQGDYATGAFRKEGIEFRERFFEADGNRFRIRDAVRRQVRFLRGNILDRNLLSGESGYHVIFCRNLLIYLTPLAQRAVIRFLERRLRADGLLFLGHAEQEMLRHSDFDWRSFSYPFAYRRGDKKISETEEKAPKADVPQRRKPPPVSLPPPVFSRPPDPPEESPEVPAAVVTGEDRLANAIRKADQGDLDQAFKLCETYLDQYPTHAHGHYLMGMLYQAAGNTRKAERHLDKAVYLDPAHLEAMEQLSLIAEHLGNPVKADRLRKRAGRILNRGAGA